MPIILTAPNAVAEQEIEVESLLVDKNGNPTLEACVIEDFLDEVDFDDLFDHEDVREFVETAKLKVVEVDGELFEDDEGEEVEVEILTGDVIAEAVDEDDLLNMFEHYVKHLPTDTLEDKARKAVWGKYLGEKALDEFQKGAFKRIGGGPGTAVQSMMLAMLHKQAIKRAKAAPVSTKSKTTASPPGTGRKGQGDKGSGYQKAPGYGPGTSGGKLKVNKYKGTKKGALARASKKRQTKFGRKLKAIAKGGEKLGAPKPGSREKTGPGKIPMAKSKKKKSLAASYNGATNNLNEAQQHQTNPNRLDEGPRLTGAILGKMAGRSIICEGMVGATNEGKKFTVSVRNFLGDVEAVARVGVIAAQNNGKTIGRSAYEFSNAGKARTFVAAAGKEFPDLDFESPDIEVNA